MSETRLNLLVTLFIQEQRNGTVSWEAQCVPPHSECRRSFHFSLSRFLSLNHFLVPFYINAWRLYLRPQSPSRYDFKMSLSRRVHSPHIANLLLAPPWLFSVRCKQQTSTC